MAAAQVPRAAVPVLTHGWVGAPACATPAAFIAAPALAQSQAAAPQAYAVPAGPLHMQIGIRIGGDGVSAETLHAIVAWALKHSPVGEPLTRVMPVECAVEVV